LLYQPIDKWLPKTDKTGFDSSYLQRSEISCNQNIKFQKFDAFIANTHNISILITVKKLALKTYSLVEVYPQSIISGLKDISQYGIII